MSAAARGAAGWLYASGMILRRTLRKREVLQALNPIERGRVETRREVRVSYRRRRVWP